MTVVVTMPVTRTAAAIAAHAHAQNARAAALALGLDQGVEQTAADSFQITSGAKPMTE